MPKRSTRNLLRKGPALILFALAGFPQVSLFAASSKTVARRPAEFLPALTLEMDLADRPLQAYFKAMANTVAGIDEELKRLKARQVEDLALLRQGGEEDEAALRRPEVDQLRGLAKDQDLAEAYDQFQKDTLILLEKYRPVRNDEMDRESRMAMFRAESIGKALRSVPDLAMYRVTWGGGPSRALPEFLQEFQPVLERMRRSLADHLNRVDAAEKAALAVTSSKVVPVAARALQVKDLQVLESICRSVSWSYFRLML